jgi:RNA polymerase sigma-70 factor (ECF subfamily)
MDIVQSAQKSLLICLRDKHNISDGGQLIALALRILQRKVARRWRKAKLEIGRRKPFAADPPAPPQGDGDGTGPAPDGLEKFIKHMSETEIALVKLRLEGHTTASAARELGLDPAYARVLLGRMRERLAPMFDLPEGLL